MKYSQQKAKSDWVKWFQCPMQTWLTTKEDKKDIQHESTATIVFLCGEMLSNYCMKPSHSSLECLSSSDRAVGEHVTKSLGTTALDCRCYGGYLGTMRTSVCFFNFSHNNDVLLCFFVNYNNWNCLLLLKLLMCERTHHCRTLPSHHRWKWAVIYLIQYVNCIK